MEEILTSLKKKKNVVISIFTNESVYIDTVNKEVVARGDGKIGERD